MTAPRTLSATPQPVRLYHGDNVSVGMARVIVELGRLAVEVVAFDGSVSVVMSETVAGYDRLTDEDVRRLRASVSGDAERAKTHDARMRIESILSEPMTREHVLTVYMDRAREDFEAGWAAMLTAAEIEERGTNSIGSPLCRLAYPF